MSEANVFRLIQLDHDLSELWETAPDTPNLLDNFKIEVMIWLVFYGGVLLSPYCIHPLTV